MLRGGDYDYERACRAVIDDLRKGRLGRVDLDGREDVLKYRFLKMVRQYAANNA